MKKFVSTSLILCAFAIAMGGLEAIVVVYLRDLYYPDGFSFPLTFLSEEMVAVEWLREITTIVMLVTVGMLAGRTRLQRFCYFLIAFGIWDIFYYAWLKVLLDWPAGLMTWDILFLIPIAWAGPVLAPVICSLTMILMGGIILIKQAKGIQVRIRPLQWGLVILGSLLILVTFMWDYGSITIGGGYLAEFSDLMDNERFLADLTTYIPYRFHWELFAIGEFLILASLISVMTGKLRWEPGSPDRP